MKIVDAMNLIDKSLRSGVPPTLIQFALISEGFEFNRSITMIRWCAQKIYSEKNVSFV